MPRHIRKLITEMLMLSLKQIATDKTIDDTPWPIGGWSDKEKATANAAFAKTMASSGFEKRHTEGLDSIPELELTPKISDDCKHEPRGRISGTLSSNGWAGASPGPGLPYTIFMCASGRR
jgi:hypothetical protein